MPKKKEKEEVGEVLLTPPKLAKLWRVSPDTILALIKAGELPAYDLSQPGSTRPSYRIRQCDADAKLEQRRVKASAYAATPRRKRRSQTADLVGDV